MSRLECFLSTHWARDASLRTSIEAMGFARSFFMPPTLYFNRDEGTVDMAKLYTVCDTLDLECPSWVPMCLNFEHVQWFTRDNGPITSRGFLALQTFVVENLQAKYPRLIAAWGQPYNMHPDEAEASRLYTCAAVGAYWKEGNTVGSYRYNSLERYEQASVIIAESNMDEMIYISPTIFPKSWRDPGTTLNRGQWDHVLNYCVEVREKSPRAMFSFWQNRDSDEAGFTDSYLLSRATEMMEKLG